MKRRVLYFEEPYRVCVREETLAVISNDAVLVETIVSAISAGTELLFYRGQVPAHMSMDVNINALAGRMQHPLSYGYACVGRVVEIGANVSSAWRDRLVFAFQPHASHFVCAPDELISLPDNISPETAAFLPNMETAVNFVMDGAPLLGERVCVLGQGVVGLLTTALLAHMPLAHLIAFDHFPMRRALALALGAHAAFDSTTPEQIAHTRAMLQNDGADLTYELTGNPDALNLAIALTGFSGRVVIGSWYGEKRAPIDLGGTFHRSRIRLISSQVSTLAPELTGRWTKARRMNVAWQMLSRVNVMQLITHRIPLEQAATAYTMLDTQPQETLQVLLTYF
jgi:2-desacetyl-2-hydroxyethyl bacteriochlorophyllide A dehydrogenase